MVKVKHVVRVRPCSCEAYPFCEHSVAPATRKARAGLIPSEETDAARDTHAGLCLVIREGLVKAFNTVFAADTDIEHPITKGTLDAIEKAIEALDKLERAYKMAGVR